MLKNASEAAQNLVGQCWAWLLIEGDFARVMALPFRFAECITFLDMHVMYAS